MRKLNILYKDWDSDCFGRDTDFGVSFIDNGVSIRVGTGETKTLGELVEGFRKGLIERTFLKEDEELEISEFDKDFIEFEKKQGERLGYEIYSVSKEIFQSIREGKTTHE